MSKKLRESNRAGRAAAIQHAQVKQERTRQLLITLAVVAVLAVLVLAGVLLTGGDSSSPEATGKVPVKAEGQALVLGDDPAAPRVVVYEDFLCPYCREFEAASSELLRERASSGNAIVEYRPFKLLQDPYTVRALTAWAAVLEGGTPQQALKFHDLLFENQPYENADEKPGVKELTSLAKEAGVDDQDVLDAFNKPNPEFLDASTRTARDSGVRGTPTVFVDGKELELESVPKMVSNLEELLAD